MQRPRFVLMCGAGSATWTDYDYLLQVREEGVYVQELREPLMFPTSAKRRLQTLETLSTASPTVFSRARELGLDALTANLEGFQHVAKTAGCRPGNPLHSQEEGGRHFGQPASQKISGWAEREGLKGPRLRATGVPLYYAIQFAPPRGSSDGGYYIPMNFIKHSLCLVYSGPPMLQLLPVEGLPGPWHQGLAHDAAVPGLGAWRSPLWAALGSPARPGLLAGDNSANVGDDPAEDRYSLNKKWVPKCITISELPVLKEAIQPSAHSMPRSQRQGLQAGAPEQAPAGPKELEGSDSVDAVGAPQPQLLPPTASPECEAPYSDYVYYTDRLAFSPKPFDPDEAAEACRKGWADGYTDTASELSPDPGAFHIQASYGTRCTRGRESHQGRGRQLLQAPSVTFVWRQVVSLGDALESNRAGRLATLAITEAIRQLLSSGRSPCALLGFRAAEAAHRPLVPPPWRLELAPENPDVPFLNSCSVFGAAMKEGLVTPEALLQSGGVSWRLPQELLPPELQISAGSVVYQLRLVVPLEAMPPSTKGQENQKGVQASQQQGPDGMHQQQGQMWILHQAFQVREPGYGEWRLRLRRLTGVSHFSADGPNTSAADALTVFAVHQSCGSVIAAAVKRSNEVLSHPFGAAPTFAVSGQGPPAEQPRMAPADEVTSETGPARPLTPREGIPVKSVADGFQPHAIGASSGPEGNPDVVLDRRGDGWGHGEVLWQEITREDCSWCSKAIEAFTGPSGLDRSTLQLTLTIGASLVAPKPHRLPPSSNEARRLSAIFPEAPQDHANTASERGWRPVGPPVLTSLSLSPATASGGRRLSVSVDFLPFAASRTRRCSPLLAPAHELRALSLRRLYFYAIQLRVTRDAAPPQPFYGDVEALGAAAKQPSSGGTAGPLGAIFRKTTLRLPVFCEDADDPADGRLGRAVTKAIPTSLGSRAWTYKGELLPADWNWQPTTYLLQWRLLESPKSEDASLKAEGETVWHKSDADVWLRLAASSEMSAFCNEVRRTAYSCCHTLSLAFSLPTSAMIFSLYTSGSSIWVRSSPMFHCGEDAALVERNSWGAPAIVRVSACAAAVPL